MEKDIINEFYTALEQNRIVPYFQPIYTSNGFEISCAEVLCRMELTNGRIILPDEFIPTLEITSEIGLLDWYMVKKACTFLSEMRYRIGRMIPLSVNLSRKHAMEWDTAGHLSGIADSYAIDHKYIGVEITETSRGDIDKLKTMIKSLRNKGFSIAVDDFGTGYSTFELIRDVEFDKLKIDKSLIPGSLQDIKARVILENIVDMSKKLNVKTIAEGVETIEQLSYLNCCGCTMLQGDFLSEPLPESRFLELLMRQGKRKESA